MGGGKAARMLAGRPLAAYPAAALAAACEQVAIAGKPGEGIPDIPGVERWDDEPVEPRHPAAGVAHALDRAASAVLVCAADMPFVSGDDCRALVDEAEASPGAQAVVATAAGFVEPLLAVYLPGAAAPLREGAMKGDAMRH